MFVKSWQIQLMEHNQFPVKLFASGALIASLLVTACNDDKKSETVISDSSGMMTDTLTPVITDTAMLPGDTSTTTASASKGVAVPNTAKKGMKGKTVITEPVKITTKADAAPDASGVYMNVDRIPAYPGGYAALQKYFNDNIRYPQSASDDGVEGTVRVAFTVDEKGRLVNPVIEGDTQGYGLDDEALRLVSAMPMWTPGMVGGKPVKAKFVLPVQFVLN